MGKAFDRACQSLHDNGQPFIRGRGAGFTRAAAPAPVMLCVDVLGFHIGLEPSLELAHQRQ
jgi:hypothetical protein